MSQITNNKKLKIDQNLPARSPSGYLRHGRTMGVPVFI